MRYTHLSPDARLDAVSLLDIEERVTLIWKRSNGTLLAFQFGTSEEAA